MAGLLGTISGQVRLDIRQAVAAYATLRAQNQKTLYALRGTANSFTKSGKQMLVVGGALLWFFGKAVNSAAEFERKMDYFGAVTGANAKQMAALREETLRLANTSIFTADQITTGVVELGKAGVGTKDIIDGIGQAMINLGAAADIGLVQSGQIITSTIQQFGLKAKNAVHVVDLMAGAANASIVDISDLGVSLKYVGGVAHAVGASFDDTLTAISLLGKAGIRGSTAGTSLRQMFISLGGATGVAAEKLQELGIITKNGTNLFFDQRGKLKDLGKVFQILQNHTKDLTKKDRLAAFRTIFNNRALAAVAILTRQGAKGFKTMFKEMSNVTAADVATKRLDNLSGDILILKSNIQTFFIKAGTPFQKQMRRWTQQLTRLVQAFGNLPPETQKLIIQTIGISGAVLVAMGTFNLLIGTFLNFLANSKLLRIGLVLLKGVFFALSKGVLPLLWLAIRVLFKPITLLARVLLPLLGSAVAALGWPITLIILGVIALATAFTVAYKKSKTFHDWVNKVASAVMNGFIRPIWNGIKAVIKWFKLLVTDPKKAWQQLKNLVKNGVSAVGRSLKNLVNSIKNKLKQGVERVKNFAKRVLSYLTFKNIGKVIGSAFGAIVRFFAKGFVKVLNGVAKFISGFGKMLKDLAPKAGYAIGFLIGFLIRKFIEFAKKLGSLLAQAFIGLVNFVKSIPKRIRDFITKAKDFFIHGLIKLVNGIIKWGPKIIHAVVDFLKKLPGRVWHFAQDMVTKLIDAIPGIIQSAKDFGSGLVDGVMSFVKDLPGLVKDAITNLINSFKDLAGDAIDAAKGFARGIWNGFKDGLGIHSPSFIEKHMVQMTKTVKDETGKLRRQTLGVQAIGKKFVDKTADLGLRDTVATVSATRNLSNDIYKKTAAQKVYSVPQRAPEPTKQKDMALVKGELTLKDGKAYISGIAQEVVDGNDRGGNTHRRMGGKP